MISIKTRKFDVHKIIAKYSLYMLIASILVLALGILFCVTPLATTSVVIWIVFGLLALVGLGGILKFIFPGKGNSRDGFGLAMGILLVALFVVLIACACTCTASGTFPSFWGDVEVKGFWYFSAGLVAFFSIFIGVIAIFTAILSLCSIGSVEKEQRVWTIIFDVLEIVLGILMIIFPFACQWVLGLIAGIYFIIVAVFGIVLSIKAMVKARKIKKSGVDATVEVTEVSVEKDEPKEVK